MTLLERDAPLADLNAVLARLRAGRGHVVAIIGEAGVGKTALLEAFLAQVGPGVRVLRGACEDLSIAEPLGPLRDLAREAGWAMPRDAAREGGLSLYSEALGVFGGGGTPTILAIEDLHWADEATLDFVRYFARRVRTQPIVLLVTSRDDEAEGRAHLRRSLGELPPDGLTRLALAPLSRGTVADLAVAGGRDPAALFELTGGNAFYVTEFLRSEEGAAPLSVQDAVMARADRLETAARGLLDLTSVFPRRAEIGVAREVLGESFDAALSDCVAKGLLVTDATHLAFRHEIARRAVEGALPPHRLVELNRRVLDALGRRPEMPAARVLHHARAARDGAVVAALAPAAARDAARAGAQREAAGYYLLAVEHCRDLAPAARAELCEEAAWASHIIGADETAIEVQAEALAHFEALGDVLRHGNGQRRIARYHWSAGDRANADRAAARAVEILEPTPGPELAAAYSTISQHAMLAWDFPRARAAGARALELADRHDRPEIRCHAMNNLGFAEIWRDPDRGRELLAGSRRIAESLNLPDDVARACGNLGDFERLRLELGAARSVLEEGTAFCRQHELDGFLAYQSGMLAVVLLRSGHFDEAERVVRSGGGDTGQTWVKLFHGAIATAHLAARRGRPVEEGLLSRLERFIARMDEIQRAAPFAVVMAERAWLGLEDTGRARALLEKLVDWAPEPHLIPDVYVWRQVLDETAEAPALDRFLPVYRRQLSGDWRGAAEAWAAIGAPYDQALALSRGDDAARARAVEIFESLGAPAAAARVREALRRDGIRVPRRGPRASTLANAAGLTRRQMDVLRLLDRGLSNAEIAETLFVSPKTVDHHVSAILARLEASSRGDAAAKARETGLL